MASWVQGSVYCDDRVAGHRVVEVPEPGELRGRVVVIRVPEADGRPLLARVERGDVGLAPRVHPVLARALDAPGGMFVAEWRRAGWLDVLRRMDRFALLTIGMAFVAGIALAVAGLADQAEKVGWTVAGILVALGILALALKTRSDFEALKP